MPLPNDLDLSWLDAKHPEYVRREVAWEREERRLAGGDDVLSELQTFDWEDVGGAHYKSRVAQALYVNLPLHHASLVTGHLRKHAPRPKAGLDFGALGEVRERDRMDKPERAELIWYNVDGTGSDGSGWEAWWDAVDVNAQGTGHRWILVEAPESAPATYEDEVNGDRPYLVEFSPLDVRNWLYVAGVLQFAVLRVPVSHPRVEGGKFVGYEEGDWGYYLLVRKGCELLGEAFSGGGFWIFDKAKKLLDGREGTWDRTNGEIPLFPHFGRKARGTTKRPAMSQSDTMELGQLAVAMMNARSARLFDFWDACASKLFVLGASPETMKVVSDMYKRSQVVAVPRATDPESGERYQPTIHDGSTGAVAADVADKLEASLWEAARKMSMEKVSTPGESGVSKDAGFAEASAPDLVRRAMLREQSENIALHFLCLRFGVAPDAYSVWPREFQITELASEIDLMFETVERSGVESTTLAIEMLLTAIEERGIISDAKLLKTIRAEMESAVEEKKAQAEADRETLRAAREAALNRPPGSPGDGPPAPGQPPIQPPARSSAGGGPPVNGDGA